MSLNHSKYLITLDSERRQVARFPTLEQQLDLIREDIRLLFAVVDKLVDSYEAEHPNAERPITHPTLHKNSSPYN
jgi:hypothetical protein